MSGDVPRTLFLDQIVDDFYYSGVIFIFYPTYLSMNLLFTRCKNHVGSDVTINSKTSFYSVFLLDLNTVFIFANSF